MQPLTPPYKLFSFVENFLTSATGDAFLSLVALIASRLCTFLTGSLLFAFSEVIKIQKKQLTKKAITLGSLK